MPGIAACNSGGNVDQKKLFGLQTVFVGFLDNAEPIRPFSGGCAIISTI